MISGGIKGCSALFLLSLSPTYRAALACCSMNAPLPSVESVTLLRHANGGEEGRSAVLAPVRVVVVATPLCRPRGPFSFYLPLHHSTGRLLRPSSLASPPPLRPSLVVPADQLRANLLLPPSHKSTFFSILGPTNSSRHLHHHLAEEEAFLFSPPALFLRP